MKKCFKEIIFVLIAIEIIILGMSVQCFAGDVDAEQKFNDYEIKENMFFSSEIDEEAAFLSDESKYINNIRWGTDGKETTLFWDAYEGASYYMVSCGKCRNFMVSRTYFDFAQYMEEKGTYTASIVAYDKNGISLTYVCSSPSQIVDCNTYTIKCYLTESNKMPITGGISINKGYELKMYTYTDKDASFQLDSPVLENYEFIGWQLAGTTKTQNPVIISPDMGNKTYIARWRGKPFSLKFDSQGGNYVETRICRYGDSIGMLPKVTYQNHMFEGWYTEKIGGVPASSSDKMPANDVTYYAHWKPVTFVITLYTKEDEVTDGVNHTYICKQITYTSESEDIVLPEISKEGYFFEGWVGEGIETPQKNVVIPHGTSGSKNYYAKWRENPCAYEHDYEDVIYPATIESDGKIVPTCKHCGKTKSAIRIARIDKVNLDAVAYTYDGKEKKPKVQIKSTSGDILKINTDYTLAYKNILNVGTGTVKITFKGKYSGVREEYFSINPKGTDINSLYPESKKITVKWKKQSVQTTGYQIEYRCSGKNSTAKVVNIKSSATIQKVLSNLVDNKDYYIKIRTYKKVYDTMYYSAWSSQKKIYVGKVQLSVKSDTMYRGQTKQLTLKYIPSGAKPTWKSSNKKIATVSSSGKITAKSLGKVTISATYKGKVYKATINVTYLRPDMAALLYEYNTHDNYFVLTIKNNSKKTVTVLGGTSKVVDCDYKEFDRNVRLQKSVTIRPGESKKIKFSVQGTVTWYDHTCFTLYYKFNLDGKTYDAKSDCFVTSKYKSGSSWTNTYWDKEWFINWRCVAIPAN